MHLPGAVKRGRATRCSHCGQHGATLKCAERSCMQHFHLACARVAGCTLNVSVTQAACGAQRVSVGIGMMAILLAAMQWPHTNKEARWIQKKLCCCCAPLCHRPQPEPYAVGCPAHEPKLPDPPAVVLTAFPASNKQHTQDTQQQQQQPPVIPEHPQLPVLRCRTTRHRAVGDVAGSGTPLAGSRDRDGGSFTPLYPGGSGSPMHVDSCGLGGESDFTPRAGSEDLDAPGSAGNLAGFKRSRGGQVGREMCWQTLNIQVL